MKRTDAMRAHMAWRRSLFTDGLRAEFVRDPRESIWCPYCEEQYDDDDYHCVTMWGEPETKTGFHEVTCNHCGRDFFVNERVRRTYKSTTAELMVHDET